MSIREDVAVNIIDTLKEIEAPKPVIVTREPFAITELAITQFPALLVQQTVETRETVTMGLPGNGRRIGTITYEVRGYVRGTQLDTKRNDLIEAVEDALDADRYRGLRASGVLDTQIVNIEIIPRTEPLAEFVMTVEVNYNYVRGSQ